MITAVLSTVLLAGAGPGTDSQSFIELYAPGHFGNWYECAGHNEMRSVLSEAKHWGYTWYGDWFDTLDCVDPFSPDPQYSLAHALWDAKKAHYRSAQALGLHTDLVITPNHVFRDQLKPEWLAKGGGRVFGQLICPSVPQARATILRNYENLFRDLAANGVRLSAITPAPYDYGGCNCEKCAPWIVTFAQLGCEIHDLARRSFPNVQLRFIGWWWSQAEHEQFADWMDAHAPHRALSIALHIPYDRTRVSDVRLPAGCQRHAFVHIGYPDSSSPRDHYGGMGPTIAPKRLEATVRELRVQGVTGVVAYSEGIYDDVNKALLGRMWGDPQSGAQQVLREYAIRYFNADAAQATVWAAWLSGWGRPYTCDPAAAAKAFAALPGNPSDWRRRQWELKTQLFAHHATIMAQKEWTTSRLAEADAFWAAHEVLRRSVYGLGPQRHVFTRKDIGLPWYASWMKTRQQDIRPASQPSTGPFQP